MDLMHGFLINDEKAFKKWLKDERKHVTITKIKEGYLIHWDDKRGKRETKDKRNV
jgi:hypothetical protein